MRLQIACLLALVATGVVQAKAPWQPASGRRALQALGGGDQAAASRPAVKPASSLPADVSLVGKPCVYGPAVLYPFVHEPDPKMYQGDSVKFLSIAPLTVCNDMRLTAAQQAACAKCIAIKQRDACLATVSNTFYGADEHSCTWVGNQATPGGSGRQGGRASRVVRTKEGRYSLGVSLPSAGLPDPLEEAGSSQGMWLDKSTCSIAVRVEVTDPAAQKLFPTAMFKFAIQGWRPTGWEVHSDWGGSFTCTLRKGEKVCQGTIIRPAYLRDFQSYRAWLSLKQEIWVEDPKAIAELAKLTYGKGCYEAGICAKPYKFGYDLRVVELPCKPSARPTAPINKAFHHAELPFGEAVPVMYPGTMHNGLRSMKWMLFDASGVEWSVRVLPRRAQAPTVPIFFAVMKMQDLVDACTLDQWMTTTCEYSRVAAQALPGTLCTARECKGRLDFNALYGHPTVNKPAPFPLELIVAYPRYTYYDGQILNSSETPAQTVVIDLTITDGGVTAG